MGKVKNGLPEGYRPTVQEVQKYLKKWDTLTNYVAQESAVRKVFDGPCSKNEKLEDILIKAAVLNDFYSTNIYNVHQVAQHIHKIERLDERLKAGDLTLVEEIARVSYPTKDGADSKEIFHYSFASKYCAHHNPDAFCIYDSFVGKVLRELRRTDAGFKAKVPFTNADLEDYPRFVEVIKGFREYYGLGQYTLRNIDHYLWLLGKDYF